MDDEYLWVEKYRPHTISECILPESLKKDFQNFVDQKNIPNMILSGGAGVGKTTVAKALCEELNCDYMVINGSLKGNIDTLRNEIMGFASSVSFTEGRKYVILDEADYLTSATQAALRNFMEEFSKNCGFILTCNYINRIIEPLQSRCSGINFNLKKVDKSKMAAHFFKRVCTILKEEEIDFDKEVVVEFVKKYMPDWRRVLNELQRYSSNGSIDSGIIANLQEVTLKTLVDNMKNKNFTEVRKWVAENTDTEQEQIFRAFFTYASEFFTAATIPILVILIGKYQYQASLCADKEINLAAFCAEAMIECEFV